MKEECIWITPMLVKHKSNDVERDTGSIEQILKKLTGNEIVCLSKYLPKEYQADIVCELLNRSNNN